MPQRDAEPTIFGTTPSDPASEHGGGGTADPSRLKTDMSISTIQAIYRLLLSLTEKLDGNDLTKLHRTFHHVTGLRQLSANLVPLTLLLPCTTQPYPPPPSDNKGFPACLRRMGEQLNRIHPTIPAKFFLNSLAFLSAKFCLMRQTQKEISQSLMLSPSARKAIEAVGCPNDEGGDCARINWKTGKVEYPTWYHCPITLGLIQYAQQDKYGHVYNEWAITPWVKQHGSSPLTRQPLKPSDLKPLETWHEKVKELYALFFELTYCNTVRATYRRNTEPKPISALLVDLVVRPRKKAAVVECTSTPRPLTDRRFMPSGMDGVLFVAKSVSYITDEDLQKLKIDPEQVSRGKEGLDNIVIVYETVELKIQNTESQSANFRL